ncbi:hypothetical protein NDU88_003988 [Pleurodeles waltl]|uniref:Secreted protein n=1 Tax=Pleurodeles waltl TaxID=8319 RepID=A0AAV7NJT4_PLEWA|nr:hypothetical protein NDU88_003988 [Pleurodeles waltl]
MTVGVRRRRSCRADATVALVILLLYANDAVLIAWTPNALMSLVPAFSEFVLDLDLLSNYTKSHTMACGPKRY